MNDPSNFKSKGCRNIEPQFVDRMLKFVPSQTDKALNDRFGISYNTWKKIRMGNPIRKSVIERLYSRIQSLENQKQM